MKKILVLVFLLMPYISLAQTIPQLQVSDLSTDRYEYDAGQEIRGSFTLNNIGDSDTSDIQYYVAVGNYGENGGILQNETTATPVSDTVYISKEEKKIIAFSITPEKIPTGALGLHVVITQKNGMILGWSKIPLSITGGSSDLITFEGFIEVDDEEYSLLSGPTVSDTTIPYIALYSTQTKLEGPQDFKITIFDRQFDQSVVYENSVQTEFIDEVARIPLPVDLKPESYAGQITIPGESNIVKFRYIVAGAQAEILNVNTSQLSVKKNDSFTLKLSYSDTPIDITNPSSTIYPENLSVRLKITNSKGEVVDEYNGPLEVALKNSLVTVDENSDEETLEKASNELDAMVNNSYEIEIPLIAQTNAKNLSFFIELYDSGTGEIFDSYSTEFPSESNPLLNIVLIVLITLLIIGLIYVFVKTKHKIPTVCLALILGSLFSAHVIIQQAEARIVLKTGWKNGDFVFAAPLSSRVDGYEPSETLPVDVTYGIWACANNGLMNMHIAIPKLNTWHSYTNAQDAVTAATSELTGVQNAWYLAKFNPAADDKYLEKYYISDSELSFQKSFSENKNLRAPSTPGMHYLPVAAWYCTSSHGCAKPTIVAYEICVNGAGVCPGETVVDACSNISGNQVSVPGGYTVSNGICTPVPICNDEHFVGQVSCLNGQEIVWSCVSSATGGNSNGSNLEGTSSESEIIVGYGRHHDINGNYKWKRKQPNPACPAGYTKLPESPSDPVPDGICPEWSRKNPYYGRGGSRAACTVNRSVAQAANYPGYSNTMCGGGDDDCAFAMCEGSPGTSPGGSTGPGGTVTYTGAWQSVPTGETCGAGLNVSCVADPISIQPGNTTIFRSTVENPQGTITYDWKENGISVGSGNTFSRRYDSIGSYLVDLNITDTSNNAVDSTSCRVTVSNCDNSHNGESTCRSNGDKATWVCTTGGWEEQITGTCTNTNIEPLVKKFEFNPNIVAAGQECKLTLEAENVSSCRLFKGGMDAGYSIPMTSATTINTMGSVGVTTGSYTVSCTGTGENPTTGFYGTKQCLINFDIREN